MNMHEVACFASQQLVRGEDFRPVAPPSSINRDYTENLGKTLAHIAVHCINEELLRLGQPHSVTAPEIAGVTYLVCLCEAMAYAIRVWAIAEDDRERQRLNHYVTHVMGVFEPWYEGYRSWMNRASRNNSAVITIPTPFHAPLYKMRGLSEMGLQLPVIEDAAGWEKTPYEAKHMSSIATALEGADEMRCLLRDMSEGPGEVTR